MIVAAGIVIVAVPVAIYPWALPGEQLVEPWDGWVWVSAVSLAPFAVVAALRVGAVITRVAAFLALVPCRASWCCLASEEAWIRVAPRSALSC